MKAEEYLNNNKDKCIGMTPIEFAEAYHQSRVNAISDEATKYIKNVKSFKGDKIIQRNVYHIE